MLRISKRQGQVLKNVPHARMSAVEDLRVYAVQLPHSKNEVWIRA